MIFIIVSAITYYPYFSYKFKYIKTCDSLLWKQLLVLPIHLNFRMYKTIMGPKTCTLCETLSNIMREYPITLRLAMFCSKITERKLRNINPYYEHNTCVSSHNKRECNRERCAFTSEKFHSCPVMSKISFDIQF